MRTDYNEGVCSVHLGKELNAAIEKECETLGLSKSKLARFLFKRWLATNARNREKTGGGPLAIGGQWS